MREIPSKITSEGQITIPAEVRRHLGINEGDRVSCVIGDEGRVELRASRYPTVAALAGAAGSLKRPLSLEEMLEIAREDHLEDGYRDDA